VGPTGPPALSPFELDRQRKQSGNDVEEASTVPEPAGSIAVADEPEPAPKAQPVILPVEPEPVSGSGETDLDRLRDVVTAALDEQGHNTAASLLGAGRWKLDVDGGIHVEVGVKKTMLGLAMNPQAWKIVREALLQAGATQKMTVAPGEVSEPATGGTKVWSRDSIEAVALGNPLVRQAQELFHAEVRSVLDLREKPGK
jgi:DNA polymerase-3 subunit gamma/tau